MLRQSITPGKGIFYAGESVTIELDNIPDIPGRAIFRTNLAGVRERRKEIIARHEKGSDFQDLDWRDIEIPGSGTKRAITLPLTEVGIFEGKCSFIPAGDSPQLWAEGENFRFKVLPVSAFAGNTVYAAFVRQFGRNLYKPYSDRESDAVKVLDAQAYTVIPPSGTFRELSRHLDHIFDKLKCRILQLLPIHPVPAEFGRMGRFGSPFAVLDYFSIAPELAEFDTAATPMEQFTELLDAVHARHGRVFMDIPVNHTGWASKLQQEHPEYFLRDKNKTFESPGAWGIVWEDLCKLNYDLPEVAEFMAQVFLFWAARGVDGFRCDAGYMVPEKAWDYIVAKVRTSFPDTIFLLEGLGGPPEIQNRLLKHSGLDWAYSEMFQNYSRSGMEYCLKTMLDSGADAGTLISFAETHDNNRLADSGKLFARSRFLGCGLLSVNGSFGFANGAEFYAREKIDVHKDSALNFGGEENLIPLIAALNTLLAGHPAFTGNSRIQSVTLSSGEGMALLRSAPGNKARVLILFNPDCSNSNYVRFPGDLPDSGKDLLSNVHITFERHGETLGFALPPGSGFAVEVDKVDLDLSCGIEKEIKLLEKRAWLFLKGVQSETLPSDLSFADDPEKFISRLSGMTPPPLTVWEAPKDHKRIVPVPAGDLLLIKSSDFFRCILPEEHTGFVRGVPLKQGGWATLIFLERNKSSRRKHTPILLEIFRSNRCSKIQGTLSLLPEYENFSFRKVYSKEEVKSFGTEAFGSNNNSSYALFPASWENFSSKYHALLAVNSAPDFPADRRCLFTGLKMFLVVEGYSRKVDITSLESYSAPCENRAHWCFAVPAGQGRRMVLEIEMRFSSDSDNVELEFRRPGSAGQPPAALILRPEVEDRINHQVTRACSGPEWEFPAAVVDKEQGFTFAPGKTALEVAVSKGSWHSEREWHYMCDLPAERKYGLEDKTDRFSPGYFHIPLAENESFILTAGVSGQHASPPGARKSSLPSPDPLIAAMRRFVVKRGELATVIAGYPWFLDWGRDTLIALRGLVKVPEFREKCAQILRAFAAFEDHGTIPNVLSGENAANYDTSDAPLYLIIGVRDYIAETQDAALLETRCGTRTLKEVLGSIISHYISGTPNGIKMDKASGLIFSPSHFTWMDTNFPAGTPREGYPVEIQALWYAALAYTGHTGLARQVQDSIEKYYFRSGSAGASDCLHALRNTPAALAEPDDHIRPNALLLITMGAVVKKELQEKILKSTAQLLIPGAIRTLADVPVKYQLPVVHNNVLLNDPSHPYCGRYEGSENEGRKKAYHNGTAWCWPFPAWCEALCLCGGKEQKNRALSLLASGAEYFERAIPGQISEVADGDAPHTPGGCPAQVWSVTELFRVREILQKM